MAYDKTTVMESSVTTQWHPAFFGSLQIEFEKEADKLIFENEHQLRTKPMAIDALIIKKYPIHQSRKILEKYFANITLSNIKVLMIISV